LSWIVAAHTGKFNRPGTVIVVMFGKGDGGSKGINAAETVARRSVSAVAEGPR